MISRTARCDPTRAIASQCVPSETTVPRRVLRVLRAHRACLPRHDNSRVLRRALQTGGTLSDMRYRIRLRSEMAQQHAAHLFRLLRTHSQKRGTAQHGPPRPAVLLHHTRGIEAWILSCSQTARLSCSGLHSVSKRLQRQLRPVCGFAAPL